MINASTFTYAGISCSNYGLKIAGFSDESVEENEVFSPSFSMLYVPRSPRLYHGGIKHDTAPTFTMTVVSNSEIGLEARRSIMSWLLGHNEFKQLSFDSTVGYVFYCVFVGCSIVYVNGNCHGFTLTGQLDSPYARSVTSNSVDLPSTGSSTVNFMNTSYIVGDYTYPTVTFKTPIGNSGSTKVTIGNFQVSGIPGGQTVSIDCETRTISGCKFSDFNKQWLHFGAGNVALGVNITGAIQEGKITWPNYALIGF